MIRADDIYVVGCGPSLKNFDWSRLDGLVTVAVNGAVCDVPNATYALTADSRFAHMSLRYTFWGTKAYRVLVMRNDHPGFHRVEQHVEQWHLHVAPFRFDGNIGLRWDEFCTGQNSGFCGMQLAVLLGAKRVHLLGMDFHAEGGEHYHSLYTGNVCKLDEFLAHFITAASILARSGITVISHSPTSRLNEHVVYEQF